MYAQLLNIMFLNIQVMEVAPKVVASEDEKYRLGYGIAGKGVKLPWYLERRNIDVENESGNDGSERVQKDE